ncbi:unnamed protein product, partial [Rotaria sp. Silwood1]
FQMRRRHGQRSEQSTTTTLTKVSNKLKQKQQDLKNGKSDNDETDEHPVITANGYDSKKSN